MSKKSIKNNTKPAVNMVTEYISTEPMVVGLVYANWCPHCTQMKPEWNKMKNELQGDNHYNVIEIEADQPDKQERIAELEAKLNGKTIDAAGYPTIFKLNNGEVEYYDGDRNSNMMKSWVSGERIGGFQPDKQREFNRRKPNNLTPKRTPFAPRQKSKSKSSKSKSKTKSMKY
jgi:thiol-disulfide isomerase/thioredoxin